MDLRGIYETSRRWGTGRTRRVDAVRELIEALAAKGGRLLDVGCGNGELSVDLGQAMRASHVHGVDIADSAVELARQRGVSAVRVDLNHEALPFDAQSMDCIYCGEVIEHVVDPDHLLAEVGRVLAPGGLVVLTTPNLACWQSRLVLLFGYQPFATHVSFSHGVGRIPFSPCEGGDHLRVFTDRALRELVALHGFRVLARRGLGALDLGTPQGAAGLLEVVRRIDGVVARVPSLAAGLLYVLTK